VVLGQDLVPYRRRAVDGGAGEAVQDSDDKPKLRLGDASQGRGQEKRTIKRA